MEVKLALNLIAAEYYGEDGVLDNPIELEPGRYVMLLNGPKRSFVVYQHPHELQWTSAVTKWIRIEKLNLVPNHKLEIVEL